MFNEQEQLFFNEPTQLLTQLITRGQWYKTKKNRPNLNKEGKRNSDHQTAEPTSQGASLLIPPGGELKKPENAQTS